MLDAWSHWRHYDITSEYGLTISSIVIVTWLLDISVATRAVQPTIRIRWITGIGWQGHEVVASMHMLISTVLML